jgi:hypothetical protein
MSRACQAIRLGLRTYGPTRRGNPAKQAAGCEITVTAVESRTVALEPHWRSPRSSSKSRFSVSIAGFRRH